MIRFSIMVFQFLLVCGAVVSCNYKIDKSASEGPLQISQELRQTISFAKVKTGVFQGKCISCHGNSGGVNLESYQSAFNNLAAIKKSVLKTRTMPKSPFPPLNNRELELITAWVEAGGPEKPIGGGDDPTETEPTPIEPTFPSIQKHVLQMKCISCHTPGDHAGRIPLVTKRDLLESPLDLVVPGNPDDSGLMIVLEPGARKFMPPPESGITPISEEEKNAIRTWIQNGAP